jgi:hypothetical protein
MKYEDLQVILRKSRWWHAREQQQAKLHPAVVTALTNKRPKNWHLVVLEHPHVAEDNTRLAYTQSDRKGAANLQTVTSIGKYLKRHYPDTPDHILHSWYASYSPDTFQIHETKLEIIRAVEFGPSSCMQSTNRYSNIPFDSDNLPALMDGTIDESELDTHPYSCYDPAFGWRMATRKSGDKILGRALVNGTKFVRSYAVPRDAAGRSEPDAHLEAWLEKQGITHVNSWPEGTQLARLDHPREGGTMCPYLDGSRDNVDVYRDYLEIVSRGEYEAQQTDGTLEDQGGSTCEDCGCRVSEDEISFVGRHEDRCVGECCIGGYTRVRTSTSRRFDEYYVPDDQSVCVNGKDYDTENLPDDIVCLEDGDYAELDDCVCIEGEYYREDDYRVFPLDEETEEGDLYAFKENTWVDGHGKRYHDEKAHWEDPAGDKWTMDEESEEVDGELWRVCDIEAERASQQVGVLI